MQCQLVWRQVAWYRGTSLITHTHTHTHYTQPIQKDGEDAVDILDIETKTLRSTFSRTRVIQNHDVTLSKFIQVRECVLGGSSTRTGALYAPIYLKRYVICTHVLETVWNADAVTGPGDGSTFSRTRIIQNHDVVLSKFIQVRECVCCGASTRTGALCAPIHSTRCVICTHLIETVWSADAITGPGARSTFP